MPNSVLPPIQVLMELLRTVFPTKVKPTDDHTHSVQDVPRDLPRLPMIWAIYVVEDGRIQTSGHSELGILSSLGASSNFT